MVKRGRVGLILRSMYQDLGIPMKIEIESDSSTANSLTDRLGAGQRTKLIDTRYFCIQESPRRVPSVSRRCLQRRTAQMLERSQSLLQHYINIASLQDWYSADHGSHTPQQHDGTSVESSWRRMCNMKQTIVGFGCEHRNGCNLRKRFAKCRKGKYRLFIFKIRPHLSY